MEPHSESIPIPAMMEAIEAFMAMMPISIMTIICTVMRRCEPRRYDEGDAASGHLDDDRRIRGGREALSEGRGTQGGSQGN
jgi:hypothetical protein